MQVDYPVVQWMENNDLEHAYVECMKVDPKYGSLYRLQKLAPSAYFFDGVFMYFTDAKGFRRLVIPVLFNYNGTSINEILIRDAHEETVHGGVLLTLEHLTNKVIWQNISNDVKQYVESCDSCQRVKYGTQLPAGLLTSLPVSTMPFADISMDFISVPKVEKEVFQGRYEFCKIWVVVDMWSKFVFLIPLPESYTAVQLIELYMRCIYPFGGYPQSIISDRDSLFTSSVFKQWCDSHGITQRMSTAYHPESDGLTERQNEVLREAIRMHSYYDKDWYDALPEIMMAMNMRQDRSRGQKPFLSLLKFHPKLRKAILPFPASQVLAEEEVEPYRQQLVHNMKKAKKEQAKYANRHRKPAKEYSVGEMVLLSTRNMPKQPGKIDPEWCGPFKVIEVRPKQTYRLELPEHLAIYPIFHTNLLKKYKANNDSKFPGRALTEPGPTDEQNQEWEIEKIIDFAESKKYGKRYLVRWKGYGPEKDQWINVKNIFASNALYNFWKNKAESRKKARKVRTKSKRTKVSATQKQANLERQRILSSYELSNENTDEI